MVFQLEIPGELTGLARLPARAQVAPARLLARGLLDLVRAAPEGARFGIHLCLGDMNHRAYGRMADVSPLVHLADALVSRWPAGRSLDFVHAPFAAADEPPPRDQAFYPPLAGLRLPPEVRFITGFVHEDRTLDEQRRLRETLDDLLGRPVDVATACGLGRRDQAAAESTMDRAAALCAE